ncbi:DUF4159 domain-containing protein [Cyanobacteria bacterium FACHB-63]|nr:DUF4159 domain-containing protein [Cyanobacteria bacterium FACHB-63]
MTHPFPPPSIEPFERLNAFDGLMINADRWKRAHQYHRQRQNAHYQAINQPGIVCGLGIRTIEASGKARDRRWVQVQPGIAIDLKGNPIVIPRSFDYHLDTQPSGSEAITVYLVASYRDPEELQREQRSEVIQETYRLEETTAPPRPLDVELCRILMQPGAEEIVHPQDVFFPGYNQIDLRYRVQAQTRPQALLRMAQIQREDSMCDRNFFNLNYLLQSVEALYPAFRGAEEVGQVALSEGFNSLQAYDLLYLTGQQKLELNAIELEALRTYLGSGRVLFVDVLPNAEALIQTIQQLAQQLGAPLQPLTSLRRSHPLRTRPFLFAALPLVHQKTIQLLVSEGIVMCIGDLASNWGIDEELSLSRVLIRTAQELGVNLLHYAWRRQSLTELLQEAPH